MEKHLKYMTIKKIQQLGCGEICFLSLNGSGENNFPTHSKILNSISGVRIVGPEIYASDFHENYGETERSGEILIRGTNTTNGIYNGLQCISVPKSASKEIFLNGEKVGIEFEDEYARYAVLGGIFLRSLSSGRYIPNTTATHNNPQKSIIGIVVLPFMLSGNFE